MPKEINKVIYGDNVLIDLTQDTVSPAKLIEGSTAHNARGEVITGISKRCPRSVDIFEVSPSANTNSITVEYDKTKPIQFAVCYDDDFTNKPPNYSVLTIFYQLFAFVSGNTKLGVITDYQGNERSNVSYGACTINTTNGTVTFAGQSSNYQFRAGRTYKIFCVYDVSESCNVILHCTGGVGVSNVETSVLVGDSYYTEIGVPNNEHFTMGQVTVTMGGVDVTSSVYDENAHSIFIPVVTGDIEITATSTNDYFACYGDVVDVQQYDSYHPAYSAMVGIGKMAFGTESASSGLMSTLLLKSTLASGGFNLKLKADSIEQITSNTGWNIRIYFYDANRSRLGSNVDFATNNTDISALTTTGLTGWVSSSAAGAVAVVLELRSSSSPPSLPLGAVFNNLRFER